MQATKRRAKQQFKPRGNLLWGVMFAAVALILLLRALDVIPDGIYDVIERAWPALLVLAGLSLLLAPRIPFGNLAALGLSAGMVAVMVLIAYGDQSTQLRDDYGETIAQPVDAAISLLEISIETRATDIELRSAEDRDSGITGEFTGSADSQVEIEYTESEDGRGRFFLRETTRSDFPALDAVGRGTLRLSLPPDVPVDIAFEGESGSVLFDLRTLALERLNMTVDSGDIALTLPAYAPLSANAIEQPGTIAARDGDITLFIPAEVSARLELQRQGSGILPEFDEDVYRYLQGDVLEERRYEDGDTTVRTRYIIIAPRGLIRVTDIPN